MSFLYKLLMVMILVGNPDSSNEIYLSIEKDKYGADQVLAVNATHEHVNKRHASSADSSASEAGLSKKIRLAKEIIDLEVCFIC